MSAVPEVRYARSREGIDIGYQVRGEGPTDIVFVPGFVSHLDLVWDIPTFAEIGERLSQLGRVVSFDKRGTGVSDRTLGFGSLEERMHDIGAVMDAAGIADAHIFGISEGGPLALLFAANHPDRVRSLAVYGTFARLLQAPDFPEGVPEELVASFLEVVEERWGTGEATRFFIQHMPRSDDVRRAIARYERSACTPQMARDILRLNVEIDIRSLLPAVRAPTLVMHNVDDPLVPVATAQHIADHLPDARFVTRPGDFHASWNPADLWFLDEVETFFVGERPARPVTQRALASVLFTDIVGSTEQATAMGDRAWHAVLDRHDATCAESVDRFAGQFVKSTGDGILATFASPSNAVECAREIRRREAETGVRIRAGVHTGEVELRGGDVGGIGVHIAARIAGLAADDAVWVSRTVKDLTTGSGLELEPCGRHALKGIPEEWDLYVVR